jgi:hypothetical protein
MPAPGPNASFADKVKWIYEGFEDPSKYLSKEDDTQKLEKDVEKLDVKDEEELPLEEQIRRDFLYIGGPEVLKVEPKNEDQDARYVARIGSV